MSRFRPRKQTMRPSLWHPPVELTEPEQRIVKRVRRAKLFVFLRRMRHELLCDASQAELAELYDNSQFGQPPVSPGLLALVTIIQAYTGASDDESVEAHGITGNVTLTELLPHE
jgi:hypothetical protein